MAYSYNSKLKFVSILQCLFFFISCLYIHPFFKNSFFVWLELHRQNFISLGDPLTYKIINYFLLPFNKNKYIYTIYRIFFELITKLLNKRIFFGNNQSFWKRIKENEFFEFIILNVT